MCLLTNLASRALRVLKFNLNRMRSLTAFKDEKTTEEMNQERPRQAMTEKSQLFPGGRRCVTGFPIECLAWALVPPHPLISIFSSLFYYFFLSAHFPHIAVIFVFHLVLATVFIYFSF